MSDSPQPFGPFGGFDLSQMMKFLQVDGPVHWQVAAQVARWVTTEGAPETELDSGARARLAEVSVAAEAHVLAATGEPAPAREIEILSPTAWAERALTDLRPVLVRLAGALGGDPAAGSPDDPMAGMLRAVTPLLLGVQCGFMTGQLARGLLSQHDLLLPVAGPPRPALVGQNTEAFAADWSLPPDDLRFYLALGEAVRARVMARSWVRERIVALACDYIGSFSIDPGALEDRLGHLDPTDPASLERLMRDPDAILGAMSSEAQLAVLARLQDATALFESWADTMVDEVAQRLVPSLTLVKEALRRHRVNRSESDRFIGRLLGLDPSRAAHDRAYSFCAGVVERAGADGLARVLSGPDLLPTPSELEAPGLWLARIELD